MKTKKAFLHQMQYTIAFLFGILFPHSPILGQIPIYSPDRNQELLNEPFDISGDFRNFSNTYYLADSLSSFDPKSGKGEVTYKRYEYISREAFNNMMGVLRPVEPNEFPTGEYAGSPSLPFSIEFISPRTIRLKTSSRFQVKPDKESLMIVNGKPPHDNSSWKYKKIDGGFNYTSPFGSVTITQSPWRVEIRDAAGKLLTHTVHNADGAETFMPILPFSFVRRASDYSTSMSAVFSLSPDEKIFGCGESFTEFNKRGQKVVLWTDDANGAQNEAMYKPIPFFLSNRGYGVFMHTSSPITCDTLIMRFILMKSESITAVSIHF